MCTPSWAGNDPRLEAFARRADADLRRSARLLGDPVPPPPPEPGSFLACAYDIDANRYGWIVRDGAPDNWTIHAQLRHRTATAPVDTGLAFGPWIAAAARGHKAAFVDDDRSEDWDDPPTWAPVD